MRYLLDTCVILWALEGNTNKIKDFIGIIENPNNEIYISVISYWEIVIKKSLGKLKAPDNFLETVEAAGFEKLNLEFQHIAHLQSLPLLHNDPFDRLLIAQSLSENCKLLTTDAQILKYALLD